MQNRTKKGTWKLRQIAEIVLGGKATWTTIPRFSRKATRLISYKAPQAVVAKELFYENMMLRLRSSAIDGELS